MAKKPIQVEVLRHKGAKRRNIPTAGFERSRNRRSNGAGPLDVVVAATDHRL